MDVMPNPTVLTQKLQALIDGAEINQREMAEIAGVSQGTVSQYLSGATPSAAVLLRIARHFGVPLDWLADDEDRTLVMEKAIRQSVARLPDDLVIPDVTRRVNEAIESADKAIARAADLPWDQIAAELDKAMETIGTWEMDEELPAHLREALNVAASLSVVPTQAFSSTGQLSAALRGAEKVRQRCDEVLLPMANYKGANQALMARMRNFVFLTDRTEGMAAVADAIDRYKRAAKPKK